MEMQFIAMSQAGERWGGKQLRRLSLATADAAHFTGRGKEYASKSDDSFSDEPLSRTRITASFGVRKLVESAFGISLAV